MPSDKQMKYWQTGLTECGQTDIQVGRRTNNNWRVKIDSQGDKHISLSSVNSFSSEFPRGPHVATEQLSAPFYQVCVSVLCVCLRVGVCVLMCHASQGWVLYDNGLKRQIEWGEVRIRKHRLDEPSWRMQDVMSSVWLKSTTVLTKMWLVTAKHDSKHYDVTSSVWLNHNSKY